MAKKDFTHINSDGQVHMVDVGEKEITKRMAIARSFISLPSEILEGLDNKKDLQTKKGPVFHTAALAGIMAVKKTSDLIPLCHPLPVTKCDVKLTPHEDGIEIICTVSCTGKTGVEMEALTGASIAALTVYDMCKSFGHDMEIRETKLLTKTGGKSDYNAG